MLRRKSVRFLAGLTAVLALGLLAGCGGGSAPAPTAKPAAEAPKAAEPAKAADTAAQAPTAVPVAQTGAAKGYFDGKTINVIVPNSPGGGIDTMARYTAPYLKKYSGAKDVIVNNVVGAAGIKGVNQLATSKPDGLTIAFSSVVTMTLQQLSGQEGVQFDATKFNYLGRVFTEPRVLMAPTKGKIQSMDDVLKLGRPVVMPIQGLDDDFLSTTVIAKLTGFQIKAITGYSAQAEVFLAALRGEGELATTGVQTAAPMVKQGDYKVILVNGGARAKDYPDVPTAIEIQKNDDAKNTMKAIANLIDLHMSYYAPSGVDPKVLAELRDITTKALTDKEAVDNVKAKTGGRDIMYMSGEDEQKAVQQVTAEAQKIAPILKAGVESVK